MQPEPKTSRLPQSARSAIAGLLLVTWLFITALTASPALHEYFHPDAGNAAHSCAVTLFAHGQLMGAETLPVLTIFVALLLFCLPSLTPAKISAAHFCLNYGRAPPCFSGPL